MYALKDKKVHDRMALIFATVLVAMDVSYNYVNVTTKIN